MANNRHKVSYCVNCGFIDLTGDKSTCIFCNNNLLLTEDFFDEICSESIFSSKDEIEEYVRQNYVYFDENFNENLMKQMEQQNNKQKQIDYFEDKFINDLNTNPICPTCGSNDVEQISTSDKIVGGLMFGLLSSNIRKSVHCKNCGYKW